MFALTCFLFCIATINAAHINETIHNEPISTKNIEDSINTMALCLIVFGSCFIGIHFIKLVFILCCKKS